MKIEYRQTKEPGVVQITTLDERWYFREADEKLFPSVTWIAGYYPKGVEFYKWLASKGWDEAEAIKTSAGDRGSRVHRAIEKLLLDGVLKMDDQFPIGDGNEFAELTVDEYECAMSFHQWYCETKPEILAIEVPVFNEAENYAGTMDLKVKIDGVTYLVDLKTSQHIWPEHRIQLSAYLHTPQGTADKAAILQVGYRKNKKLFKFTEVEDVYDLFLSAKKIWWAENEGVSPRQKDYPIQLTIPTLTTAGA
jgi:hypothetical protein